MATTNNIEGEVQQAANGTDTNDIADQINQLRDDIATLAKSVAALSAEKASEIQGKTVQVAQDAIDRSGQAIEGLKQEFVSLEESAATSIRNRPFQSVGLAMAAGFVLAAISRR